MNFNLFKTILILNIFILIGLSCGKKDLVLIKIGPSFTYAGQDFNVQPNGFSAIWLKVENATESTVVVWENTQLDTTYENSKLITAVVPNHLYSNPGEYKIYLMDLKSGKKSINNLTFTVYSNIK